MSSQHKSIIALLCTTILWSIVSVIAKIVVKDIPPLTVLFLRLLIATIAFSPIFYNSHAWRKPGFKKLIAVSLLATVNFIFFIWGIQFTTATASQIIYAALPLFVIIFSWIIFHKRYPQKKITGVFVGLSGIVFILYLSSNDVGQTISGGFLGNITITIAMISWTLYLLFSKSLSKYFSPFTIGSSSIIVSFVISSILFIYQSFWLKPVINWTIGGLLGIGYIGFFGTFFTYILYQYAIKHISSLTVSLFAYLTPIMTAFIEILIFNNEITLAFIFGCMLVFSGIFITTIFEFQVKRNNKHMQEIS